MSEPVKVVNLLYTIISWTTANSPDDKEHAVDTDWFPSATVNDESGSSLKPDALTMGVEEPVVATERLTFLKYCE